MPANEKVKAAVEREGIPFSDLNEWMLKVLLAPQIPKKLLRAPRGEYRNAAELARGAAVSPVHARRFVGQLRQAGYLDESAPVLRLVRLGSLFRLWIAAAQRPAWYLRVRADDGVPEHAVAGVMRDSGAVLALHAAADAWGYGHVSGYVPTVYVPDLEHAMKGFRGVVAAQAPEQAQVVVRKMVTPKSILAGAVRTPSGRASDVLQVFVDVALHPVRGHEQADLLWKRIFRTPFGEPFPLEGAAS